MNAYMRTCTQTYGYTKRIYLHDQFVRLIVHRNAENAMYKHTCTTISQHLILSVLSTPSFSSTNNFSAINWRAMLETSDLLFHLKRLLCQSDIFTVCSHYYLLVFCVYVHVTHFSHETMKVFPLCIFGRLQITLWCREKKATFDNIGLVKLSYF